MSIIQEGALSIGIVYTASEEQQFYLFPEGDYDGTISKYELKMYTPGAHSKLTECQQAIITVNVTDEFGHSSNVRTNIYLHSRCLPTVSSFFYSIGRVDADNHFVLDFKNIEGLPCRVKLGIRDYTDRSGTDRQTNEIIRWLKPDISAPAVQPQQTAPAPAAQQAAPAQPAYQQAPQQPYGYQVPPQGQQVYQQVPQGYQQTAPVYQTPAAPQTGYQVPQQPVPQQWSEGTF